MRPCFAIIFSPLPINLNLIKLTGFLTFSLMQYPLNLFPCPISFICISPSTHNRDASNYLYCTFKPVFEDFDIFRFFWFHRHSAKQNILAVPICLPEVYCIPNQYHTFVVNSITSSMPQSSALQRRTNVSILMFSLPCSYWRSYCTHYTIFLAIPQIFFDLAAFVWTVHFLSAFLHSIRLYMLHSLAFVFYPAECRTSRALVGQLYLADKKVIDFDSCLRRFPSRASDSWITIFSTTSRNRVGVLIVGLSCADFSSGASLFLDFLFQCASLYVRLLFNFCWLQFYKQEFALFFISEKI